MFYHSTFVSGPPQITSEVVEVAGVMGQQVEHCELYCTVLFCTAHYLDGECVGGGRGEVPQHAPGHAPHQPQDQGRGERPAHRAVRGQQHRVLQPLPRRF